MKIFVTIILIVVGMFLALRALSHVVTQNYCESWGENTGRETKFISNFPLFHDCLVNTDSGWVSGTKFEVRENNIK